MFLAHPNPAGVKIAKSYPGEQMTATIGADRIVYNPTGREYSQGKISGNARLFASARRADLPGQQRQGSQYGVRCNAP